MLETDSPFKGALFLRGSADKKSCKANFSAQPSQNISFEFGFDDCPSRRKRQVGLKHMLLKLGKVKLLF